MHEVLKVSVGKLVAFSCRSGDLVHSGPAGPTALQGQAAHKAIQAARTADTQAEVTVKTAIEHAGYRVMLQGRIDLVTDTDDAITLGEIKSTYVPADKLDQSSKDLHAAQLKVYGYCYLRQQQRDSESSIELELIWFNIKSGQQHHESASFSFAELERFTLAALDRYLRWHEIIRKKRQRLLCSAADVQFPLGSFRPGQREMAAAIYCSARDAGSLLLEAPTGIGKTASALFAASKALAESYVDRFIYLTAKNSGREAAALGLAQLRDAGLALTAITITAKKTSCHCSNGRCARDDDGRCPLTLGFFDRLPAARTQLITQDIITPQMLDDVAGQHQLCPFELVQQMLPWVDAIVCDYNYVLDPLVRFAFFEETASRSLLLVDEAHNLLDRARSMHSAQLNRYDVRAVSAECKTVNPTLHRSLQQLSRAISRWANLCTDTESASAEPPAAIGRAITQCAEALIETPEGGNSSSESIAELAREIYRYLVIEDIYSTHHRAITLKKNSGPNSDTGRARGNVQVQLRCLDASDSLRKRFALFRSAAVFSATLRPLQFYLQSMGLPQSTTTLALNSPFATGQQLTRICRYVDTRYHAREASLAKIVDIIRSVYRAQPGNYQVFFPSYAYMESCFQLFAETCPDIPALMQQRNSTDHERESYLGGFNEDSRQLGFAIMGGIFGEGIDYVGDRLIGSIVIGTGLPSVTLEQKLIERHYEDRQLSGFDYASRYPGLTRVLQTAGRVIRGERDRGIVILIDGRFDQPFYRALYPNHWHVSACNSLTHLDQELQSFWADSIDAGTRVPVSPD